MILSLGANCEWGSESSNGNNEADPRFSFKKDNISHRNNLIFCSNAVKHYNHVFLSSPGPSHSKSLPLMLRRNN